MSHCINTENNRIVRAVIIFLILIASIATEVAAETCMSIRSSIRWNSMVVEVNTFYLPLKTRNPYSFVGGRGFDYLARFESTLNSGNEIELKTLLAGTSDACNITRPMVHTPNAGDYIDAGNLICGRDEYHLSLQFIEILNLNKDCQ